MLHRLRTFLRVPVVSAVLLTFTGLFATPGRGADRFVAAQAAGDGHGTSAANAAGYLDERFWNGLNRTLADEPVVVHFAAGRYEGGGLTLTAIGSELHGLTLRGEGGGAVFASDGDFLLYLKGCRNVLLQNLHFTGKAVKFGVTLIGLSTERRDAIIPVPATSMHAEINGVLPCRDIVFDHCTWIDLPDVFYGSLCLSFNTDHVTVRDCTFRHSGLERHAHMMYNGGGSHHIFIYHNVFEDNSGTYVRFRDRSDYGYVCNNVFRSTGTYEHEDASSSTFIELPLFNSFDPGNESFGTNFQIIGNTFAFAADPVKRAIPPFSPEQNDLHTRDALRFWQDGFETRGYRTLLTKDEGYTLTLGAPSAKRALLLANCGINTHRIVWYGNTYTGPMQYKATYACTTEFGAFPKSRGFETYADISNALTGREMLHDDFEDDPETPANWATHAAADAGASVGFDNDPGGPGQRCMRLFDGSTTGRCMIDRAVATLDGLYFSAWFKFGETTSPHVCLGDGTHNWIVAGRDGCWENDRGRCVSNATYMANKWYHVELVMAQGARDYSVWIDGVLVSKDILDPVVGPVRQFSGRLSMSPADDASTGSMLVDDVVVATLGERADGLQVTAARRVAADTVRVTFSEAPDVGADRYGPYSALNPLNYMISQGFFPAHDFLPVGVTQVDARTFNVKVSRPLTADNYVWLTTVRSAAGLPLSPTARFRFVAD